jgi:hypothetical protein
MILDGRTLEFYKYEGDYKPLLENVKDSLNRVAENWSRDQKDQCLEETETSFKVHSPNGFFSRSFHSTNLLPDEELQFIPSPTIPVDIF